MTTKYTKVQLSQIIPDPNQPRKVFNPQRLADLRASIDAHGVMTPLEVEKNADGTYHLIDGERRYRAAQAAGLTEVPVSIRRYNSDVDRAIKQFQLQEQREGWTATEKAQAVAVLSREIGTSVTALARELALPEQTIRRYRAFYELRDSENFQAANLNIERASQIKALTTKIEKAYKEAYNVEEVDEELLTALEHRIVDDIVRGKLTKTQDFVRLGDALKTSPALVEGYANGAKTISEAYAESGAKIETHRRTLEYTLNNGPTHVRNAIEHSLGVLRGDETVARKVDRLIEELSRLRENI